MNAPKLSSQIYVYMCLCMQQVILMCSIGKEQKEMMVEHVYKCEHHVLKSVKRF